MLKENRLCVCFCFVSTLQGLHFVLLFSVIYLVWPVYFPSVARFLSRWEKCIQCRLLNCNEKESTSICIGIKHGKCVKRIFIGSLRNLLQTIWFRSECHGLLRLIPTFEISTHKHMYTHIHIKVIVTIRNKNFEVPWQTATAVFWINSRAEHSSRDGS